ncbi:hypothetical protein [Caulobacter soli]|uniref:hypothetical protein n=1 Tax=Caulobacter soli TaxID=2708539 RepID=UPI0013EB0779|nr:hypothetical protein [Caulobacter soli]
MKWAALLSAAFVGLGLSPALPSAACTPAPGWPFKVQLDPATMARTLVAAATSVDVVVAEDMTDDYEVGTDPQVYAAARAALATAPATADMTRTPQSFSALLREEWRDDGARVHYRVAEHLKGSGAETFALNGARMDLAPLKRVSKPQPLMALKFRLESRDLSEWEGFGSCITALYSQVGKRYLVFRDADGRLLRQPVDVLFMGKTTPVGGPVYAEVFGPDDPWLIAVRQAAR